MLSSGFCSYKKRISRKESPTDQVHTSFNNKELNKDVNVMVIYIAIGYFVR